MNEPQACWNWIQDNFNLKERIVPDVDGNMMRECRHFVGCAELFAHYRASGSCAANISTGIHWFTPPEGEKQQNAHARFEEIAEFGQIIALLSEIRKYLPDSNPGWPGKFGIPLPVVDQALQGLDDFAYNPQAILRRVGIEPTAEKRRIILPGDKTDKS